MEKRDARWLPEFEVQYGALADSIERDLRVSDPARAWEEFAAGDFQKNPDLAPEHDIDEIAAKRRITYGLQDKIADSETDDVVIDSYIPRVQELADYARMLEAAVLRDGEAYLKINRQMYGEPSVDRYAEASSFYETFAREAQSSKRPEVQEKAKHVLDVLPVLHPLATADEQEAAYRKLQVVHVGFYDAILQAGIIIPEKITGDLTLVLVQRMLDNLGLNYSAVPQNPSVRTAAAEHSKREFLVPLNRIFTHDEFIGMFGHEAAIHITERVNGEEQALGLLQYGLADYLVASEGKGVNAERVVYDTLEEFLLTQRHLRIANRHMAVSLARGIDGGGERDFKEIFGILLPLNELWQMERKGMSAAEAAEIGAHNTWEDLALRALKGVVGKGMTAFKDELYLEGSHEQRRLLDRRPEVFPFLNRGKYNLANPAHVDILERIGTIPEGLAA